MRLLYIHNSLNPAVQSPHVPWLLVPLYSVLVGETDEDEVAHAEADTFWVFEALIAEIAQLEEEDGRKVWTQKLSERIKWADGELATRLVSVLLLASPINARLFPDSMQLGWILAFRTIHSKPLSMLAGILLTCTTFWSVTGLRRYWRRHFPCHPCFPFGMSSLRVR